MVFSEEWDEWEILFDVNKCVVYSEFYLMGGMVIMFDNIIMVLVEDFFFDVSMVFVFVIWKLVIGIWNCWIMLNLVLFG